jgi:hypothetical protein
MNPTTKASEMYAATFKKVSNIVVDRVFRFTFGIKQTSLDPTVAPFVPHELNHARRCRERQTQQAPVGEL